MLCWSTTTTKIKPVRKTWCHCLLTYNNNARWIQILITDVTDTVLIRVNNTQQIQILNDTIFKHPATNSKLVGGTYQRIPSILSKSKKQKWLQKKQELYRLTRLHFVWKINLNHTMLWDTEQKGRHHSKKASKETEDKPVKNYTTIS